jgi:hypothetical protein
MVFLMVGTIGSIVGGFFALNLCCMRALIVTLQARCAASAWRTRCWGGAYVSEKIEKPEDVETGD